MGADPGFEAPLAPPADSGAGGGEPPAEPSTPPVETPPEPSTDTGGGEAPLTPPSEEQILETGDESGQEPKPTVPAPVQTPQQQAEEKLLGETYREHPALKPFLQEHPELRPQFFKAVQFEKLGLRTIKDAETAIEYSQQLVNFDRLYFSDDPKDAQQLVQELWDNQIDPATGASSGHFDRVAEVIVTTALENLNRAVVQAPDFAQRAGITPDQAKLAVTYIAKMLGLKMNGASQALPGSNVGATDAERRLAEREAALTAREQALSQKTQGSFEEAVYSGFESSVNTEIDKALKPIEAVLVKQPMLFQKTIRQEILNRVVSAIESDRLFESQFEAARRRGNFGPEHAQQLQEMLETRAAHFLPSIARTVMTEAGLQIKKQADARESRLSAAAGRREPAASGSPGKLGGRPTPKVPENKGDYNKWADELLES